jgi:hypothetical protein
MTIQAKGKANMAQKKRSTTVEAVARENRFDLRVSIYLNPK